MKLRTFAIWALVLLFAGVGLAHLVAIDGFVRFLPEWVPIRGFWVIITGVLEIVIAVGLAMPGSRKWAAIAAFSLLLIYAPLHVIDVMRDAPVIGPKVVAIMRLPLQLLLLYLAWIIGWGTIHPGKPTTDRQI